MAAPAFGAIGTQLQGSASTMNVAAPSGVAVNDILIVMAFVDTAGATVTGLPSGWAQAPDSPITGPDNHKMYVMWKRADAGDTGASTFDFTLSTSVYRNAACSRYTGATTSGTPYDVTNGVGSNNSQTTTEDVADTTTVADTLLVWGATNWSGGSWTPPSGFTERRDTGDGVCTSADKVQAVAGSTGVIVGTCTGSDKRCAWVGALSSGAAAADSSSYSPGRLLGLIGPDGQIFAPTQRYDDTSTTAVVTGSATETQDNQTSTASGVLGYTGTSAVTQANQTSTATGILGYSGTVAVTQTNQTSTATGVLGYTGTSATTQANQTSSASGTVTGPGAVTGSAAVTQTNQTSTASGVLGYSGSSAQTQANQTSTAAGWITVTGTVARTQANQTSTASGTVGSPPITGTSSTTQANQTAAAAGFIGAFTTPDHRTFVVEAGSRTLTVDGNRTFAVPTDPRTLVVPAP